jgi:hypothetical protein
MSEANRTTQEAERVLRKVETLLRLRFPDRSDREDYVKWAIRFARSPSKVAETQRLRLLAFILEAYS